MILQEVEVRDVAVGCGVMRIHMLRPTKQGRYPGVLLFSEIYQVTAPIRRLAAMLAGHGYVVAVPEVYHEYEEAGAALAYDAAGTARGNKLKITKSLDAFDADARAGLDALSEEPACNGRFATLGVCLGGHLAYRASLDPRVAAAACFYSTDLHSSTLGAGQADDSLNRMTELRANVMFVWGRQDPHIPFRGRELIRNRLEEVGATYEWHEFDAQHAFLRDEGVRFDPALYHRSITLVLDLYHRMLTS